MSSHNPYKIMNSWKRPQVLSLTVSSEQKLAVWSGWWLKSSQRLQQRQRSAATQPAPHQSWRAQMVQPPRQSTHSRLHSRSTGKWLQQWLCLNCRQQNPYLQTKAGTPARQLTVNLCSRMQHSAQEAGTAYLFSWICHLLLSNMKVSVLTFPRSLAAAVA